MSEELKPCPFCGGEARAKGGLGWVGCSNPKCDADAISAKAWNTRAHPTEQKWQPIETNPRDDEYIGIIECAPGRYGEPFCCHYTEKDGHRAILQTDTLLHKPTHWQPLPKPPKETKS